MLKQVGGNTCEAEGCYGYARDGLCVLHKLEKSEARVAELEAGICSLLEEHCKWRWLGHTYRRLQELLQSGNKDK